MNIPDDKITHYTDDNAIIIDDARIFSGVMIAARTWGVLCLDEPGAMNVEEIEELMATFATKAADLREKYEVSGDLLDGRAESENAYFDELNELLTKYRTLLFKAALDYVLDDEAIDMMRELLRKDSQ